MRAAPREESLKAGQQKKAEDMCGADQGGWLDRLIRSSSDLPSDPTCSSALISTSCSRREK